MGRDLETGTQLLEHFNDLKTYLNEDGSEKKVMFSAINRVLSLHSRPLKDVIHTAGVPALMQVCNASKKSGGSARKQGKPRRGKRRGIKANEGSHVKGGAILVKQLGFKFHPGKNVGYARDHSLYALCEGYVKITTELLQPQPFRMMWREKDYVERKFMNVLEKPKPRRLICVNKSETNEKVNKIDLKLE